MKATTGAGPREVVKAQAVVRGYLVRRKYAPLLKRARKRTQIVGEILDTERSYVQGLHVIVGVFLNPLRSAVSGPCPVIDTQSITQIFSIVEALLAVNQELLKNLEQRYKNWSQQQTIGDVFLQMSPHLKGYSEYCRNYDYAVSYLDRLQASTPALAHFICSSFPEAKGLSLSSYLIMPVQRIPRYTLLIQDLLKHTDDTHPDYQNLSQAHVRVQQVADYVNNSMQMALTNSVILRIQRHLGADITQLLDSTCVFKKEGKFRRIKGQGPKATDRLQMFLFNDLLLVAEKSFGHIRSYKWKVNIPMKGLWLQDIPDNSLPDLPKTYKNLFYLVGPKKAWIVFPKKGTLQEKNNWMRDLQQCIDEHIARHPENKGVRNEFKMPFISTSSSTITIRRKGPRAAIAGEPSDNAATNQTSSLAGGPRSPLLSSALAAPGGTRASRSFSDLSTYTPSMSPPTASIGGKGSGVRRPRPAAVVLSDPQAIFSSHANSMPSSPPVPKREPLPVIVTTSSPSLLSLAMRPTPPAPAPPPPAGGDSGGEGIGRPAPQLPLPPLPVSPTAPRTPPRPDKQQPAALPLSPSVPPRTPLSPPPSPSASHQQAPTSQLPPIPERANNGASRHGAPPPPTPVATETQAQPASNWDATLKEDRPLCSNRHFCTIKDAQHWVEYKHSTSTAEVMAKLRNPRAQGKLYGSNTLDARSRVRPAELRKGDNP